jgi:tripartite-type tricarboxylate transporter receptor subunit TctC
MANIRLMTLFALLLGIGTAVAQTYPTKPLRLVVAAAPGGTPDILARIIAPKLAEQIGQPVIVDNRPGATGNIGADVVAKAPRDGYTLLMATAVIAISPSFYKKLPFDPVKDLAPVTQVASQATFLFVQNESPVKSLKDLVALAKARPGTVSYASFGIGSPQHVAGELLQIVAGVKFIHVPYKSGGLMVTGLLSGEVQFMFLGLSPALPHVKSGRLRTIAVASAQRNAAAPDVPTFTEAGVPGVVVDNWLGVFTTGGAPKSVVDKLNAEIVKAVRTPDTAERIVQQGLEVTATSPAEFAAFYRAELAKIAKVVRTAGIEPQ